MGEEPVNIDIIMRQNVEEEGEKASRAINEMAEASDEAWKRSKEALQMQRDVIARLKKELEPLQSAFDKVNVGTIDPKVIAERERLSKAVRSVVTELKGEEAVLKEMMGTSDGVQQKTKSLEAQMRTVREEMSAMALAGKKESTEYREKEQQLGTLATAYREVYNTQTQLQKGGANLQGIVSGLGAISGLLSAGAGAMGLFNSNSEEFNAIQTKMQSLMAITIGLQQVQNTLHQTSAFRIQTLTKAKQMWAGATNRLTIALGISNVAAKALMGTLTLGLSVAIGFAIDAIDTYISKQKEAKEEQNRLNESIAKNSAEQIANYERLRTSYNQLGDDLKAKELFILENQDAFKQLGVSINTVNDADNLFIRQTEAFKSAVSHRARATAAMELAAEKYKEALKKREDAGRIKPSAWRSMDVEFDKTGRPVRIDRGARKLRNEAEKKEKEAEKLIIQSVDYENKAVAQLNAAELKIAGELTKGTKAWWEAKKKNAQARIDALTDVQKGSKEWIALEKEIQTADKAIKKFDTKDKKPEQINNARKSAADKLEDLSYNIEKDINAATIAAMQEGRDKKLDELKADYDARVALIVKRQKEIEELERTTGADGSKQKGQLSALSDAEKAKYEAQVKAVTDGSAAALDSVWEEINARFNTESQNRLAAINRFYKEQIARAKENGMEQMEIDLISADHKRDLELEKRHIALETLEFESQIAIRRAQIEDKQVWLQAEREKKILRARIEHAQKYLKKLQEIQSAGGDTGKKIEAVTAEIEEMNAELNKIPVKKLQEIGGYLKNWLSTLSGIGGEAGQALSALASGVDDVMAVMDKNSTNGDKIGVAIGGLVKLYNIAANQIEENKRKQKEWNDAIEDSVHKARMMRIEEKGYRQSNVFGVENPYAKAISGANQYAEVMKQLNASLGKLEDGQIQVGTKKVISGKNVVGGAAAGATAGAAAGSLIPVVGTAVGAIIGGIMGGIFGATRKKVVPIFNSLVDEFGSILKEGTETFELNPKILENYEQLDEDTRKLVDNWEEVRKKAIEAQDQMRQSFKDLAGDIGGSLSDALVNAFRNGDIFSAMDEFDKKISQVIENIIAQMVFAKHFKGMFDELDDRMNKSFGKDGDGDIRDDIAWFGKEYKKGMSGYKRDMDLAKEELRAQGIDVFKKEDSRKSAAKGIAQASQDSIDELNGRLTFLVMKVSDIGTINATCLDLGREQLLVQRAMLGNLEVIAENSDFLRKLKNIAEDIAQMRIGINIKKG